MLDSQENFYSLVLMYIIRFIYVATYVERVEQFY